MSARDFAHLQPDNAEVERAVLAQEVETLRNRLSLRQIDVSKECGVNASMLSQWMLGRYKGNVSRINGLMESWLIRRRGGKPVEKGSMNMMLSGPIGSSPKLKRRLEELNNNAASNSNKIPDAVLFQRKLYDYPKPPPSDTLLIPIRLDVDVDGYRYIDSFSWNLYEQDYTYETFADTLIRDLDLPASFRKRIASQIHAQVEKSKRSLPWHEATNHTHESLHPIFINIRIRDTILIDRFEWDLCNASNSPETFAHVLCDELGLSGEFEAQVALTIREQLRDYSRLMREGLRDRVTRLPPVTTSALRDRADAPSWEPTVKFILADDIPLLEREDYKRMRAHSQTTIAAAAPSQPLPVASTASSSASSAASAAAAAAAIKANKPPKPVNTFLMFCRDYRKKVMTAHQNMSAKDASKILGEMWKKLTDQQRASYIPMTEQENQRRLQEWRLRENRPIPPSVVTATGASTVQASGAGIAATVAVPAASASSSAAVSAARLNAAPASAVRTTTTPTTTPATAAPVTATNVSAPLASTSSSVTSSPVASMESSSAAATPQDDGDGDREEQEEREREREEDDEEDDEEEEEDDEEEEEEEEEEEIEDDDDSMDDDDVVAAALEDSDSEMPIDVDMILDGVDLDLHL